MELDLENPLASADDDEQQRRWASVSALFAAELDHAIAATIDIAVRRDAVSLILQGEKPRIVRLLSVSCLSLASKMTETHFPLAHFQVRSILQIPFVSDLWIGIPTYEFAASG
ncbi:hypothetical protein B296_00002878 [Ensete ventricosum]|uniref:Uncharacterized protein n=1 Tax=Ensete ventricosum TaxID=4639 RepID=A0A427BA71_ENSVE|nr:hypothetical protein B296_00002878 [Ensete ventricosum]